MDPVTIAMLAISIGKALADAYGRAQIANAALENMLEEKRGPTPEELEALRAAGADVDARLDELLAPPED
jgi:hypothetical protein